jgi:hypothetical protein
MPQSTVLPSLDPSRDDVGLESQRSGCKGDRSGDRATYSGQTPRTNWLIPSTDTRRNPAMSLVTGIHNV